MVETGGTLHLWKKQSLKEGKHTLFAFLYLVLLRLWFVTIQKHWKWVFLQGQEEVKRFHLEKWLTMSSPKRAGLESSRIATLKEVEKYKDISFWFCFCGFLLFWGCFLVSPNWSRLPYSGFPPLSMPRQKLHHSLFSCLYWSMTLCRINILQEMWRLWVL